MDSLRLIRDTKGGRRHEEVETEGFKVIGGAPTTLRVMGLMMMMMTMTAKRGQHLVCVVLLCAVYNLCTCGYSMGTLSMFSFTRHWASSSPFSGSQYDKGD